jgi:peroxiredoxin
MCSDFFPHGEVTKAFGIMRQEPPLNGISERAAFIVDKSGKIIFAKVYPLDQAPKSEELLEALRKVNS